MDYQSLAEQLVKKAVAKGADAAEAYVESRRTLNVAVRNGDLETVQEATARGASFRVFVKGRMASANSNDLEGPALDQALTRAIEFARVTTADPNNVLPAETGATVVEGLYDPAIAQAPMERKIELAKSLEQLAMKDPRITKSAGAGYDEVESEIALANSNGLARSYRSSVCGIGVQVVAEKGEQKSPGGKGCTRRFLADLRPVSDVAADAIRQACEMLDPRPVRTQKAAVIFHADVSGVLLRGILGAVNGERVIQGASFLGSKLGQPVASSLVTVVDDGTRPKGLASRPFDGEGVATGKRTVVEKGVLKGFMYNTAVARRAGTRSTGNATRGGGAGTIGIGPHNFYMEAGTSRLEDLIAATKVGLLLKEVTGYGINAANGNFSGGAEGLWIEDGRIVFPVKGLTIAGTAAEMLGSIDMLAADLELDRGLAAPSLRIPVMQIGGE